MFRDEAEHDCELEVQVQVVEVEVVEAGEVDSESLVRELH